MPGCVFCGQKAGTTGHLLQIPFWKKCLTYSSTGRPKWLSILCYSRKTKIKPAKTLLQKVKSKISKEQLEPKAKPRIFKEVHRNTKSLPDLMLAMMDSEPIDGRSFDIDVSDEGCIEQDNDVLPISPSQSWDFGIRTIAYHSHSPSDWKKIPAQTESS